MAEKHPVLFLTRRGQRHQELARAAAPEDLAVKILRRPPREEILRLLPGIEFLVTERAGTVDAEMIAAGRQLRLIQRLGSLAYDIDLEAARAAGVPVATWPIEAAIRVAEHVVMQMLALAKRLGEAAAIANEAGDWGFPSRRTDEDTFAYNWSGRGGIRSLYGQTVGILGFGEIGAEVARRLQGFGPARVLYHKRHRLPQFTEEQLGISYTSLEEGIAVSDFVCSLLPYAPETERLLDGRRLATMKRGAFLVHCGSGSVVDEMALARVLRDGHLAGAALDTYEWEPVRPDNPLLSLARDPSMNVLLTPHTAAGAWSEVPEDASDARAQLRRTDYTNLVRILRGEPILHRIA